MASLTDVWDGVGEQPTVVYKEPLVENIVSSKISSQSNSAPPDPILLQLEALVMEIHELRKEQARRCTVYMILVGLLFGTLIMYIDRLQSQVKSLRHSREISRHEHLF
tara:strand:- start:19 stop:342 length:324 start_codon:yes stop_codon:yes gene_type:complete